jgi:NADPH2:quinone reductase
MQALEVRGTDGPEAIVVVELPTPEPTAGSLVVRVLAAGVNFADVQESRGTYPPGRTPPYLPGQEMVGEVVAIGAGVTGWQVGDQVYGGGDGTFAEYVVAPADALVPVPEGWTPTQTAGLFSNWLTAYAALRTFGRVAPGETVLIHAAAGGVGQAAVRIALALGAEVVAAATGPDKRAILGELGVTRVVDPTDGDLAELVRAQIDGRDIDLVIDGVGGSAFAANLSLTASHTGRIVVIGIVGGDAAVTNRTLLWDHQVHLLGFNLRKLMLTGPALFAALVRDMFAFLAEHQLRPGEPTAYDLAEGPKVLALMEQRQTIGKLVLVP